MESTYTHTSSLFSPKIVQYKKKEWSTRTFFFFFKQSCEIENTLNNNVWKTNRIQTTEKATVLSTGGSQMTHRWQNVFCNSPSPKSINSYSQKDETHPQGEFLRSYLNMKWVRKRGREKWCGEHTGNRGYKILLNRIILKKDCCELCKIK